MNQAIASNTAAVDAVFWFIAGISVFFLLLVTGLMIYFAVRYHHQRHPKPQEVHEHPWLEITWTIVPTIIVLAMFWYGYRTYLGMRAVPADAMVIKVTGMMWKWEFEYPNGKRTETLYVPLNKPVKLEMRSTDVIHGFYIPAFRVKEDVVPGRETYLWFKPQGIGPADIFCSQYCGVKHAYMISRVEVLTESEFEEWYGSDQTVVTGKVDLSSLPGIKIMEQRGCLVCHRLDGAKASGPSLLGSYGRRLTVSAGGQTQEIVADEDYLRRAILDPSAEIVKGYPDVMPPPRGLMDAELQLILDAIKALK